jgi:serine/threonine protein kinase/outer membrane protein assembly factor BamD (BamD/ComL family)
MAKKTKSRYELKEELGEGGMGVVWRAYDTVLNTDVALKMLLDSSDTTALKLFQEECFKQSALAHPNIVEIRDAGTFDEDGHHQPYLVMPLLHGTTLATVIRSSSQPLSVDRCVDIISQACRGLQAAHDFGLLHRDIKPSNLFILEDDSVKIIDFGVAHRLDVSRTMSRKGTLLYMSPEQVNMKPLTRASDVFSLAVVCYEALTRKQPFLASTEEAVVEAIRHVNPPPAASLNPNVSVALSQVLCKAMAKDARHRFASAKEFADYLRRAHYDESFTVFDPSKFAPRLEKAAEAHQQGNLEFARELINELESEGYLTPEVEALSATVQASIKSRTISQLLESARARIQDGEYRLALQRVHEVLQLEPRDADALVLQHDIEARRAEADIADWLRVGQQHLDKFSFAHARQAAQRVLEAKPGEERALHFLQQVERRESEVQRIREHKRRAYEAALEAEKRNDLTSALNKMKTVLELEQQAPDLDEPGRLASYQSLYNKLHSEHEAVASSYAEAKRALERDDYVTALRLCDEFLEKFPQHTLFKALKFDTEQRWRKAVSLRLIEVEEAAENEPDLNQRVRMLEEVVRESPEVREFSRLLQGAREKRDLVHGIVSRARELEGRELYAEALVQWETLQTIYPGFPGLNYEIENVRLRRDLGERMARKNHWITEINQAVEEGDFDAALKLVSPAIEEFPNDNELTEMRAYIRQNQELAEKTEKLIAEGRRLLNKGDLAAALEKLRRAYENGSKVKRAKVELIEGLLRAARTSQGDSQQARTYLNEILALDPGNHAATGLIRFLDDQDEYKNVDEVLSQARQLRTSNDVAGAIALLERAAADYPRNARVRQMLRELDADRTEIRNRDLQVVRRKRLEADGEVSLPSLNQHVAAVEQIAGRYKNDEEFQQESRMVRARLHTIAATVASQPPPEPATQMAAAPKSEKRREVRAGLPKIAPGKLRGSVLFIAAGCGAVLLLVGGAIWWRKAFMQSHAPGVAAVSAPALIPVSVSSTPQGARILRDGKILGVASPGLSLNLPAGTVQLEAQLDGYEPQSRSIEISAGHREEVSFTLAPVAQQFRVVGDGVFSLNGGPATRLSQGMFTGDLPAGTDEFHWMGKSGYDARFRIAAENGKPASIVSASGGKQAGSALMVSMASQHAHIYTTAPVSIKVDGAARGNAGSGGMELDLSPGLHTIEAGSGPGLLTATVESGRDRLLLFRFENAPALGSLTVLTDADGVALKLLRGTSVVRQGISSSGRLDMADLPAGRYTLQAASAAGAAPETQAIVIKKGESATVSLSTKKAPVLLSVRVHTLPGASIVVDGAAAGTTSADGNLLVTSLAPGPHRIEAHRKGKNAALDLQLNEGQGNSPSVAELELDKGPGVVALQLDPAGSEVAVYTAKGDQVSISGLRFGLPEGKYRFVARANGYADREEVVDVAGDSSVNVDLKLSPITISGDAPSTSGWESGDWKADAKAHTIAQSSEQFALYGVHPSRGRFLFAGPIGHGFLTTKRKVEWVANYHDPANYLLFTLEHDGLEMFTISGGKKTANGKRISFPSLSKYQIMLQITPGHILTSLNSGQGWKQISDWSGLPDDVDAGRFGFKGPITLTSFSYVR